MRGITVALLALVLASPDVMLGQTAGTVELALIGSPPRQRTEAPSALQTSARIALFLTPRFAVETQQNGTVDLQKIASGGSLWLLYALPVTHLFRMHAAAGAGASGRTGPGHPRVIVSGLVGGRVTIYDWLGLRLDVQLASTRTKDEEKLPTRRSLVSANAGFSLRIRE
jgi:hypothetical protein